MENICEEIKQKLEELKALDTELGIFGASSHKYDLNPVINEQEIGEFEQRFSCKLPASYKLFLTTLGNGGAGPSYGLFPLGFMDEGFDIARWSDDCVNPDKPFKFTDYFNDTSMLSRGAPEESEFSDIDEYESAYDQWMDENYEELQMEYWLKHALDGAIPICHHGCANRSWLVVSEGKEYGNIWNDDTPDEGGVYPEKIGDQQRISFDQWYLDWLVKSIKEIKGENA